MTPYYEQDGIVIYHGDMVAVLPLITADALITDPPYPHHERYGWAVPDFTAWPQAVTSLHGFIFWSGAFTLPYTARHIWAKANRNVGLHGELYEECYEINGSSCGTVWRHAVIDSPMNATLNGDVYWNHPCQKPIRLMLRIVNRTSGVVLDPFMGSGTTLVAAKRLGRKAIGIELEERYCEIAAQRLQQGALDLFGEASA